MLTKYTLEIDGERHELPTTCIKNWDEICCAYKRTEFSGVMRTFTSQFEFVNEAYDMLLRLYQRDGVYASAILTLYTITERWEWEERFTTRLDFSTVVMDDYVLTCHALNTGLSTMIKANKNTKYEFLVGEEVPTDKTLHYDRVAMRNSLEYGITTETIAGTSYMRYSILGNSEYHLPFYSRKKEIATNGLKVETFDQQESKEFALGPKFLTVGKSCKIRVTAGVAMDLAAPENFWFSEIQDITVIIRQLNSSLQSKSAVTIAKMREYKSVYHGTYKSLPDVFELNHYITHNDTVWVVKRIDGQYKWIDSGETLEEYRINHLPTVSPTFDMAAGDSLSITMRCTLKEDASSSAEYISHGVIIYTQKFRFEWEDRGEAVEIDTIKPATLCEKLLEKISNNTLKINCHFSEHDPRLANISLLAAESIRNIENAKVYSSFNEFCDFMRAVFGYTYYLGDVKRFDSGFQNEVIIDHLSALAITAFPWSDELGWPEDDDFQIALYEGGPNGPVCGVICADNKIHTRWAGSEAYNDPETNAARSNVLFRTPYVYGYYIENGTIQTVELGDNRDSQDIYFVHQSEMLPNNGAVRKIRNVRELTYKADESFVYSEVNIGYKKQNYDNINGRGEFNFNNTYSTGYQTTEKKLSIVSPYRADSYGIEFACQKRTEKTTDSASDKDVFVIHTSEVGEQLVPNRDVSVSGALTDTVFNTSLSPLACIEANKEYINMQKKGLLLEYASSEGYSLITIGGNMFNKNHLLGDPLVTYGRLEFFTDDVDTMPTATEIIEVESHGIKYRGYLESATFRYAVEEEVHYNLLVKEIEVCD